MPVSSATNAVLDSGASTSATRLYVNSTVATAWVAVTTAS